MKALAVLALGSVVCAGIDSLLGLDFSKQCSFNIQVLHKLTYMAWGGIAIWFMRTK